MQPISFPDIILLAVCIAFGAAGIVHIVGPGVVRRAYQRWGYLWPIYRVIGILELMVAVTLTIHKTREAVIILGGAINFVAVVSLLKNREYGWALPGVVVAIALPVMLVATLRHF